MEEREDRRGERGKYNIYSVASGLQGKTLEQQASVLEAVNKPFKLLHHIFYYTLYNCTWRVEH